MCLFDKRPTNGSSESGTEVGILATVYTQRAKLTLSQLFKAHRDKHKPSRQIVNSLLTEMHVLKEIRQDEKIGNNGKGRGWALQDKWKASLLR